MILGITQARFGSTRLPGKVLLTIQDKSLLEYHLQRAIKSKLVDKWLVATTYENESHRIIAVANNMGIGVFQGDTKNVLSRFFEAAERFQPDYVIRVTSDCPLLDPVLIDQIISYTLDNGLKYCTTSASYPDGVDVEVFKFSELLDANKNSTLLSDMEHVTPYIKRKEGNNEEINQFPCIGNFENIRFTVDEDVDFKTIEILINSLGEDKSWNEYADFIIKNPGLFPNQTIIRNEGYLKSIQNNEA